MPEEEKEKPNLDEIAEKLANMEEEHKVDQILPSVMDAFLKYSKYEKDGKTFYKTNFSDEEKEKIADAIMDSLSYHLHVRWYNMTKEEWEERKKKKSPLGESEADVLVRAYLGVDRDSLKKTLKKMTKIEIEDINKMTSEWINSHIKYIQSRILKDIGQEHTEYIKDWVKEKAKKYSLDPEYIKRLDKSYKIEEVLPVYNIIATNHYKKDAASE